MKLTITYATVKDLTYLKKNDKHLKLPALKKKLAEKKIIIARDGGQPIGWLRYGFFWDEIPIMNMLSLEDSYQRKGIGSKLVKFWESEMRKRGHKMVMTSTQVDECAQHFYRKIGYKDSGALYGVNDSGAAELFLIKKLK